MKGTSLMLLAMCVSLCAAKGYAQVDMPDAGRVSIHAVVPDDEGIPAEACHNLQTRLQRLLADNGLADNGLVERFVLTVRVDIVSKDVVPSTPARVSQRMEVTFMVGDVVEDKLFGTCSFELTGVGTNETKAFVSAFSGVESQREELLDMLDRAKEEIVDYYASNCDGIVTRAMALDGMDMYDEAIFQLMSVLNVCADCYRKCQETAKDVYVHKIDHEGAALLNQAKAAWAAQPCGAGAQQAASFVMRINPLSTASAEAGKLLDEMGEKLKEDEKREWTLQVKRLEGERALEASMVDACKSIGMAWASRRPRNVLKSIFHGWM